MKLWLLRILDVTENGELPTECDGRQKLVYDVKTSVVVRAPDEEQARVIAHNCIRGLNNQEKDTWLSARYTDCQLLTEAGKPGVIFLNVL